MYDQGDQEDKEIAAEQDRAAQVREELPEEDDADAPSPCPPAAVPLPGDALSILQILLVDRRVLL